MKASLPEYLFSKLTVGYSDNEPVDRASFPIDVRVTFCGHQCSACIRIQAGEISNSRVPILVIKQQGTKITITNMKNYHQRAEYTKSWIEVKIVMLNIK